PVSIARFGIIHSINTTSQPPMGSVHGLACIAIFAWPVCTLVECHDDIGTDRPLGVDDVFGGESVPRAINVGGKKHAFLCDLARAPERIHLVPSAVGQDGPVPTVEFVQAARA